MTTPRPWGVFYTPDVRYAGDWKCHDCGYNFFGSNLIGAIVGFTEDAPTTRTNIHRSGGIIGAFILECPQCFVKSYFHAAKSLVEIAMEDCPNWPKGDNHEQPS